MSTPAEVQSLLRFLSQDAKLPLATAMSKIGALREAKLLSPELISKSDIASLQKIFNDEKLSRQVLTASKRSSKKRSAGDDADLISPSKRRKSGQNEEQPRSPAEIEASLVLPAYEGEESELESHVVRTNRAPLVLAFAIALLKYTMPSQPLSSRLSLAQAVVSANSRSKAASIGLESKLTAEEEGWGQGQPGVRVMGREIRCLKRWGYDWRDQSKPEAEGENGTESEVKSQTVPNEPALWGLDVDALRSTSTQTSGHPRRDPTQMPIFTAESARAYLLKSFHESETKEHEKPDIKSPAKKKKSAAVIIREREDNAAKLLAAIDLLYQSFKDHLSTSELDRRAWTWYVQVRPDVADGVAGWGGKGDVPLSKILSLRRRT